MNFLRERRAISDVPALLLLAMIFSTTALPLAHAQQAPATRPAKPAGDAQAKDKTAIDAFFKSFVKAFESRDAKALAALWTSEGEYENDRGVSVHGRAELERTFAELFSRTPEVTVSLKPDSLRFLSADSAIAEGTVVVQRGAADTSIETDYSALVLRDAGQWRLAQLSESAGGEASIDELAWLIGEWQSQGDGAAEIHTTYAWSANKKFIHARFTIKEQELQLSGDQVIGVDPATGSLRTWTFEADGGVAESEWSRDGDHWVLDVTGSLVDGTTLFQTNILRRIDQDTLTLQSVDRTIDGNEIADLPPTKIVRVKPATSAARK